MGDRFRPCSLCQLPTFRPKPRPHHVPAPVPGVPERLLNWPDGTPHHCPEPDPGPRVLECACGFVVVEALDGTRTLWPTRNRHASHPPRPDVNSEHWERQVQAQDAWYAKEAKRGGHLATEPPETAPGSPQEAPEPAKDPEPVPVPAGADAIAFAAPTPRQAPAQPRVPAQPDRAKPRSGGIL